MATDKRMQHSVSIRQKRINFILVLVKLGLGLWQCILRKHPFFYSRRLSGFYFGITLLMRKESIYQAEKVGGGWVEGARDKPGAADERDLGMIWPPWLQRKIMIHCPFLWSMIVEIPPLEAIQPTQLQVRVPQLSALSVWFSASKTCTWKQHLIAR